MISTYSLNTTILRMPGVGFVSNKEYTRIQQVVEQALASNQIFPMKIRKKDVGLNHSILILQDKTPVLLIPSKEGVIGKGSNNVVTWGIDLTTGKAVAISRFWFHEKESLAAATLEAQKSNIVQPLVKQTTEAAIKTIKREANQEREKFFQPGLKNLQQCQGERVVSLIGACTSTNRHGILRQKLILEYCEGGDLQHAIPHLSTDQKKRIVSDLLEGVEHIHSQGMIHSDLKPANVLLSKDKRAKVTDFEFATSFEEKGSTGTRMYRAPELELYAVSPNPNVKTDAWALGLSFYELLATKKHFKSVLDYLFPLTIVMNAEIRQADIDALIDQGIPKEYRPLLKSLLQIDFTLRSSVQDARVAWDELQARCTSER